MKTLRSRVILAAMLVFVTVTACVVLMVDYLLEERIAETVTAQQQSLADSLAKSVDTEVAMRLDLLRKLAASPELAQTLAEGGNLQELITRQILLNTLFNGGIIVYDHEGTALADTLPESGRIGTNYRDIDVVAAALNHSQTGVGIPVIGKRLQKPVFGMATPIVGSDGKTMGVMAGVVNLGLPNFLDPITRSLPAQHGSILAVSRSARLIVTASDPRRVMERLPAPGNHPEIDRFLAGGEGSTRFFNPLGIEVLVTVKQMQSADWYLAVLAPTQDVFATVSGVKTTVIFATLPLLILATLILSHILGRQFSALSGLASHFAKLGSEIETWEPAKEERDDEIGRIARSFNRLLARSQSHAQEVNSLRDRHQAVIETAHDAIITTDAEGRIVDWNPAATRLFGYTQDEAVGQALTLVIPERFRGRAMAGLHRMFDGDPDRMHRTMSELMGLRRDGSELPLERSVSIWQGAGGKFFIAAMRDITERKRLESRLRIAASAFEVQHGTLITDADANILMANRALLDMTGYSAEDLIGATPRLFKSGRHDATFFKIMWDALLTAGHWEGEIWDRRKNGEIFPKWLVISAVRDARGKTTHYVGTQLDISERKAAEYRIRELAYYDPLTGLPNRTLLNDRMSLALATSQRNGQNCALLLIDLDNFKTLNDTQGHSMGDQLLRQVAQRLSSCVRDCDTVARLGGDEFVVILSNLGMIERYAVNAAETVTRKIAGTFQQPYTLDSGEFAVSASIGVTLWSGRQVSNREEILKQADLAMYKAKASGKNTISFFDPELEAVVRDRVRMERDLRTAIEHGQMTVQIQPQIDGNILIGGEVLLRWRHPEQGPVSPARFIPLAEETGLINDLGRWVLHQAGQLVAQWAADPGLAGLTLAVNVSVKEICRLNFTDDVQRIVALTGAAPERLKLELTESMFATDIEPIIDKMQMLRQIGFRFSLDDFGTGYSSLSYLKRLPLSQLKIDQSFVRDVLTDANDAAIARTVVALGQSLGLNVIAEGVETPEQRDFLAGIGCLAYQGYFYSRPLDIPAFVDFSRQFSVAPS